MTAIVDCLDGCSPKNMSGIIVGNPEWFAWVNNQTSFRFLCQHIYQIPGSIKQSQEVAFTAVKQGRYWYAHKRVRRSLRRAYLGAGENLTYDCLCQTARTLTLDNLWQEYESKRESLKRNKSETLKSHKKGNNSFCETGSKQSADQVRELQERIAQLEKELAFVKQERDNYAATVDEFIKDDKRWRERMRELEDKAFNEEKAARILQALGVGRQALQYQRVQSTIKELMR